METDLMISAIDEKHRIANRALENRDIETYASIFDEQLKYTNYEGKTLFKKVYLSDLKKYFKSIKTFETSHYRIKSALENDVFTEKIARKSILKIALFLFFSKKQTIQTEEIFHWKNMNGDWKVIGVEVVLEEKY